MKRMIIGIAVTLLIVGGFLLFPSKDMGSIVPTSRTPAVVSAGTNTPLNQSSSDFSENVKTISSSNSAAAREITLEAQKFTFAPAAIRVKEGERVTITVRNIDATHGISIPAFNARGKESVEFVATKKGNYPFYCATYCGSGHPDMQGTLIVE